MADDDNVVEHNFAFRRSQYGNPFLGKVVLGATRTDRHERLDRKRVPPRRSVSGSTRPWAPGQIVEQD